MTITDSLQQRSPQTSPLFPTLFLAGFECSTHVNVRGERQDLVKLTQHDKQVEEDYARVKSVGIGALREGVPWYRIDRKTRYGTRYDFRPVMPFIEAGERHELTQIWDLFHYGFPTYLFPFAEDFPKRFADYCAAFARLLVRRGGPEPRFYTPINEPSFYAWAGGEVGWFAPFERGRGFDLKLQLAKAAIAGTDAIRAEDPTARIVNVDPISHTVAPTDAPELADDAARFNTFQWQTWDMISGREWEPLGGSAAHLDVIGVNYYLSGQWEHCRGTTLDWRDPRRRPLRDMLLDVARRYPGHPILVTETGCWGEWRPAWLREVMDECRAAAAQGANIAGVTLYPIIDMPDWHGGHFMQFGLWDLVPDGGDLKRELYLPYLRELKRQQAALEPDAGSVTSVAGTGLANGAAKITVPYEQVAATLADR